MGPIAPYKDSKRMEAVPVVGKREVRIRLISRVDGGRGIAGREGRKIKKRKDEEAKEGHREERLNDITYKFVKYAI